MKINECENCKRLFKFYHEMNDDKCPRCGKVKKRLSLKDKIHFLAMKILLNKELIA